MEAIDGQKKGSFVAPGTGVGTGLLTHSFPLRTHWPGPLRTECQQRRLKDRSGKVPPYQGNGREGRVEPREGGGLVRMRKGAA